MSEENGSKIETHPIQTDQCERREVSRLPTSVTLAAYEVYCYLYGEQAAMVNGGCRGGFSVGEIIAFLYARSFPPSEWRTRTNEAMKGMKNL